MDQFFTAVFTQWGSVGVLLSIAVYIIVDNIKNRKINKVSEEKLDDIKDSLLKVKSEIPTINTKIEYLEKTIARVDNNLNLKVEKIEELIDKNPQHIINELDLRAYNLASQHNKQMINQIQIAPQIHEIMGKYIDRIGCDHMFLGWFHNGTSSISGVPFYKFDIVAEKFNPIKNPQDYEFGHMYKDVDILRHNKLPIELIQNKKIYYKIDPDNKSDLFETDDILYRRMVAGHMKQLAINVLQDQSETPIGFIGCICFEEDDIDFKELQNCAYEIIQIYKF